MKFFSLGLLCVLAFALVAESANAAYITQTFCYSSGCNACSSWGYKDSNPQLFYKTGSYSSYGGSAKCQAYSEESDVCNVSGGETYNAETLACEAAPPPEPEECFEQGQVYNSATQSCDAECDGSLLSGFCFPDNNPDDPFQNEDCSSDSPDWQGTIGYGDSQTNVCSGQSNCAEGQTYGVVNGKQTCVNNDFGLPDCGEGQYASVDDYGASCNSFDSGPPNDPLPPPEPNTDTDADGTPDEYRPENDPNATTNAVNTVADGVSGLQDLQNEANDTADKTLSAIDRLRKENNSRLDTLIDQGANPVLPENAKLSEKSLIPTFAESASAFSAAVASNSAIQLVGNIVVPTSSTCPVYTLPATPISSPITMDIHCSILANHSGLISSMFLFAWSLLGLTIFLKA